MSQALHKLIERKQKFLESCTNERTKIAINVEINLLKTAIEEMAEAEEQQKMLLKQIEAKKDETDRLIIICNLYGIDLSKYILFSKNFLLVELKKDREENYIRVPQKVINAIQQ